MFDVPCYPLVSSAVSGWELLPGVFALNYRILMPHHGRSGSVKRATKPESESETETEAETDMETETETQKQKPKLKPTKKCHTCLPTILFTRMGACRTLKTLHKC